ncbi:hypothetical protein ACFLSJ_05645 [Verrucomicrobiota bacterium]
MHIDGFHAGISQDGPKILKDSGEVITAALREYMKLSRQSARDLEKEQLPSLKLLADTAFEV